LSNPANRPTTPSSPNRPSRSTVVNDWNRALMIGMTNVSRNRARNGASRIHGARFCALVAFVLVRNAGVPPAGRPVDRGVVACWVIVPS
jgi:hypothetical protein